MRTTCVATMLEGGHAPNALPQTAKATVNCRMLPGEDAVAIEKSLTRVMLMSSILMPMPCEDSLEIRWNRKYTSWPSAKERSAPIGIQLELELP